jgi:hypothetical protein
MSRSRSFKSEKEMQGWWTRAVRAGKLSWGNDDVEWLAASGYLRRRGTCALAYELKLVAGRSLALSKVEDHQWMELRKATSERAEGVGRERVRLPAEGCRTPRGCRTSGDVRLEPFNHKISDSAVGFKPCDGVIIGLDRIDDAKNGPRIVCDGLIVVGYEKGARIAVMSVYEVWRRYGDKVEGRKRGGIGMSEADSVIRAGYGAWV